MKFTLREYHPSDLDALVALDQACYAPEIAYSRREMRAYLKFPNAECLVAEERGEIVGFILTAHEDNYAHIITLDVAERFRRRGIGSALVVAAEERLRARGTARIGLETAVTNEAAVAFWRKHGYRTREILPDYYSGALPAYGMTKPIGATAEAVPKER